MGTALVTGATSGIGEEFCWQLAAAGHNLVIVARNEQKLNETAQKITQAARVKVEVLPADLTKPEDVEKVCERLTAKQAPVGLLVNNAGMALGQPFAAGSYEKEEYALDLMVRSVMRLAHAAANAMGERGRGAILNVSSIASRTPYGTYAAHKAWVRSFTEGLALEMAPKNVTVTALMPGWVMTEFQQRGGLDHTIWPKFMWIDVAEVVSQSLAAVRRGQVEVVPTWRYAVLDQVMRLAPRSVVRQIASRIGDPEHPVV
ncbi:short-chain dehydrogenase [Boudabousia tangfeifanii]|uniref:Short-chain dehydrogenase n=1 Tax=Boudabousia tangfeifanii TaxID=1912795 RepID=A0A1D9MLF6_9ACTO|nr:SDR family oxidoreductase [Boudabousia tangfeifanii]AOZ73132.1 short-chain dehydrogenase [Boudabousia tangfeifanii]